MQIISLVKCSSNNVIPERLFSGRASLVYFKYSYFPAFILRLIYCLVTMSTCRVGLKEENKEDLCKL